MPDHGYGEIKIDAPANTRRSILIGIDAVSDWVLDADLYVAVVVSKTAQSKNSFGPTSAFVSTLRTIVQMGAICFNSPAATFGKVQ